jgi:S1-C subfamily serine protease
MSLAETYPRVRPAIVAFVAHREFALEGGAEPLYPFIIGTGFVASEDGIVITNDHVIREFENVPRLEGLLASDRGVSAVLFHYTPTCVYHVPVPIIGTAGIIVDGKPAGRPQPDVGLVLLRARSLPTLALDPVTEIREGMELATAGFLMGREAFVPAGFLEQATPTLQSGIVSAVLPFPQVFPEGFTLNVMARGGASGSPIFHPDTGSVVGLLYAMLRDVEQDSDGKGYPVPTNISYAVPAQILRKVLDRALGDPSFHPPADTPTLAEMLATMPVNRITDTGWRPRTP